MVVSKLKPLGKQGLFALAIVMTMGGLKAGSTFVKTADAVVDQTQIATPTAFSVCSEASDWQRPSPDQQAKQLATDARYSALLRDKEFQQLADQFWQHDILSFTTYGLSARMEPVNLSGLWSVSEEVWNNCYSQDEGSAINAGNLAEAWVMNHRVVDVQWETDRYVMVVEPNHQGMQVVQFERREAASELPLEIITTQGITLEHHSANW
ncbi:MAG: hypothetical protein AAGA83_19610 [Cyanobacteria bacterium P01_F01_bin.116]